METATTPDDLCIALTILKGHIEILRSNGTAVGDFHARNLQRVLATVEEVEESLKQAYIHAPTATEAATLRAILYH